ncbi:MAG TPA: hypothetical protein VFX16_10365 [Pseudonocardiaceae bacterium]|nr:hypothetical protein [Pseudonocardiaceae bacterium]
MTEPSTQPAPIDAGTENKNMGRRSFIRTSAMGAAAVAATAATAAVVGHANHVPQVQAAAASSPVMEDSGAGFHAEMGTMQMLSAATLSPKLVTCAVGQMGLNSDMVAALAPVLGKLFGPGFTGPFAMLMFAEEVTSYDIDRSAKTITAKGNMRSITKIAGLTIDDAMTQFLAIGTDNKAKGTPDTFFLSYKTPFWNTATNPLATPSQFVSGFSQFGGELIMGQVNVAS